MSGRLVNEAGRLIDLVVPDSESGTRLDLYLARHAGFVSREGAKKAIKERKILVNGRPSKPSYLVKEGDVIRGVLQEKADVTGALSPEPLPLNFLHEDSQIVVVDKPAGLVVHPGAGNYEGTLVQGLLYHCGTLAPQGTPLRPGIVHRLDKETSGVLVVAKTAEAYASLVRQFKEGGIEKRYHALVYGSVKKDSGLIDTGINRHPVDRKKMAVVAEGGRRAITLWKVIARFKEFSLLEVEIKTGRTHQIRTHLSYMGHPVVGDVTYGGKKRAKTILDARVRSGIQKLKRHLLHASFLSFEHPLTGKRVSFGSPLPGEFEGFLDLISEKNSM